MKFNCAGAAAVFGEYERRLAEEHATMAAMQPGEMGRRRDEFLLPVGEEAGMFLHSLVMAHRPARIIELGTSYGYSTLFLADAASSYGGKVTSFDLAADKQAFAAAMLEKAGLGDSVTFRCGDAVELLKAEAGPFGLVLLDIWKDMYVPCFEALYPKLEAKGILLSDNMIQPEGVRESARALRAAIKAKPDMQTVLLPIGQGIELSVRWVTGSPEL